MRAYPTTKATRIARLRIKSHKQTIKKPQKHRLQNMSITWILKMQDLSVDKTVDSVNKSKWAPMDTNGAIRDRRST